MLAQLLERLSAWLAGIPRSVVASVQSLDWRAEVRAASSARLTSSTADAGGTVTKSATALVDEAARKVPGVDLQSYTLARLASSEYGKATPEMWAAVIDAELNRAERRKRTVFEHLCPTGTYGKQGGTRPAATTRDPTFQTLAAARAVLDGRARGIARGAERFFDPRVMDVLHRKDPARVSCDALNLLDRWSYNRNQGPTGKKCPPGDRVGDHTEAWVGQIPGIDPWELMLMRPMPPGPLHDAAFQQARAVILAGRRGLPTTVDVVLVAAVAAAVGYAIVRAG